MLSSCFLRSHRKYFDYIVCLAHNSFQVLHVNWLQKHHLVLIRLPKCMQRKLPMCHMCLSKVSEEESQFLKWNFLHKMVAHTVSLYMLGEPYTHKQYFLQDIQFNSVSIYASRFGVILLMGIILSCMLKYTRIYPIVVSV